MCVSFVCGRDSKRAINNPNEMDKHSAQHPLVRARTDGNWQLLVHETLNLPMLIWNAFVRTRVFDGCTLKLQSVGVRVVFDYVSIWANRWIAYECVSNSTVIFNGSFGWNVRNLICKKFVLKTRCENRLRTFSHGEKSQRGQVARFLWIHLI